MIQRYTMIFYFFLALLSPLVVQAKPTIEFVHSWETEAEKHALHVFKDAAIAKGAEWIDTSIPSTNSGLQDELYKLIEAGTPPTAIQWINITSSNGSMLEMSKFASIDEFPTDVLNKLLPDVRAIISRKNQFFLLPVGIHTYNFMVYNKAVLEAKGLSPAKDWEELVSYGELLEKDGIYLTSTSTQYWQVRTLFRTVVGSYLNKEEFSNLTQKGRPVNRDIVLPALEQTLKILAGFRKYSMPDNQDLPWAMASARVEEGKALTQILGDYIVPIFKDRSKIVCSATPASKFIYWGMDSFALIESSDEEIKAGQAILVDVVMDPQNMKEYIYRKGGIPVTSDLTQRDMDSCNAVSYKAWSSQDKLYVGLEVNQDRYHSLFGQLSKIWGADEEIDPNSQAIQIIDTLERL